MAAAMYPSVEQSNRRRTAPGMDKYNGVAFSLSMEESGGEEGGEGGQVAFLDTDQSDSEGPTSPQPNNAWLGSGEFSGSRGKGSWGSKGGGGGRRCVGCLLCFFLLSTSCLGAVLLLLYTGHIALVPKNPAHGAATSIDLLPGGPGRTVTPQHTVQTCTSPACVQTASSILTRMNISADPCNNFYNYACGGYVTTTRLSWIHARRREIPDDVVERYETYLMDRLSSDLSDKDDATENHLKLIYRSCLFRPRHIDNETVASVESLVAKLGGLALDNDTLEGSTDLTSLLADVTRRFGASPFFKLIVRDSNTISIINKYSDPLVTSLHTLGEEVGNFLYQPPSDFYFSKSQDTYRRGFVRAAASLLGLQLIHDVRQVLNDVFSFHLELHKTLYSEDLLETGEDLLKGPCYSHLTPATLQEEYPGYLIDWQAFLRKTLSRSSVDDVTLCRVSLNTNVQNVLRSTPKFVVKRYVIIHALLHSDLTRMLPTEVRRWLPSKSPPPSLQVTAGSVTDEEERECVRLMVLYEAVPADCGQGVGACGGSLGCGEGGLGDLQRRAAIDSVANSLSLALQSLLSRLFSVSPSSAGVIVSTHVSRLSRVLLVPMKPSLPAAPPSGRKFIGNVVALLEHHQGRYHRGEVTLESTLLHNQAIRHMLRCPGSEAVLGPVGFHFASPPPVHSASLGSLLASRVAENFAIEDLLGHYAEDVLNHSAVITLALRLQCLSDFYSSLGPNPEQGLGQTTRSINWQDHFSLLLAFEAWKNFIHANQGVVHLPGLDFPNDRLFFLLYSQTMCEKVGQRGVVQHYNDKGQLPVNLRVNGLMMNFREFPSAFNCPKGARMNPTDKCSIL